MDLLLLSAVRFTGDLGYPLRSIMYTSDVLATLLFTTKSFEVNTNTTMVTILIDSNNLEMFQ